MIPASDIPDFARLSMSVQEEVRLLDKLCEGIAAEPQVREAVRSVRF